MTGTKRTAIALMLVLVAAAARADMPPDITNEEVNLLPGWCRNTQNFARRYDTEPRYREMLARYGEGWSHMHHYCWALIDVMRLSRPPARGRRAGYVDANRALQNIDYVVNQTRAPFPFRPEMLVQRTRVLARTGDLKRAIETANALASEWPTLPDGYVLLAELLQRVGRRQDAAAVLARGDGLVEDKARYSALRQAYKVD